MLDESTHVGTSTPKADPSGDYAYALFAKTDIQQPGAQQILEAKSLQLTGAPNNKPAPEGRNTYAWVRLPGDVQKPTRIAGYSGSVYQCRGHLDQ